VTGGPGSGKSVIALSPLGELSRQGRTALHAMGSRAFTETVKIHAGKGSSRLKALFKYFNSFIAAEPNSIDVLICDEAHRIRHTSANRFTPATNRTGRLQVDELISVAPVPVFLLDEHQVVRSGEIGTAEAIEAAASARGLRVHTISLEGQFRCGGSSHPAAVRRGRDVGRCASVRDDATCRQDPPSRVRRRLSRLRLEVVPDVRSARS